MSRHRKQRRNQPGAKSGVAAPPAPVAVRVPASQPPAQPRFPRTRVPIVITLLLAAAWLTGLALLALWTANPPALNVGQIERSDNLVTAKVIDDADGRVLIERDWKLLAAPLEPLTGEIRIANWKRLAPRPEKGSSYLIPLIRDGRDYYIALPGAADPRLVDRQTLPRIYPATPEFERQAEQAVAQLRRS